MQLRKQFRKANRAKAPVVNKPKRQPDPFVGRVVIWVKDDSVPHPGWRP